MLNIWLGNGWAWTAGIRTEPDSSGKSHLVHTVPQSGEASELLAASLETKATEPKDLLELGELKGVEKASDVTEK